MSKPVNTLLWIGLTGTLLIGSSFVADVYHAFWGDHSVWWTHRDMPLSVEKTSDYFELYVARKPLQRHLSEKTLFSLDNNGNQFPLVSEDITVRLNHWDKVKSSILTNTTFSGFGLGVSMTLFVIGLVQSLPHSRKPR